MCIREENLMPYNCKQMIITDKTKECTIKMMAIKSDYNQTFRNESNFGIQGELLCC